MLNRRQVVSGVVSLAVFGSRSWRANAAPARRKSGRVSLRGKLSKSVFLALLGESFTVSSGDDTLAIELIQIDDGLPSEDTEQFSLVFRGPHDPAVPEGPHTVSHRTAGRTTLFLQFSGHDKRHSYYEAPFNLLL
jgi:Domain of unknown function (DUF6916)